MPSVRILQVGTTKSGSDLPKMLDFEIRWPVGGSDINNLYSRPFRLWVRDATVDASEWIEIGNYMSKSGTQKDVDVLVGVDLPTDRWLDQNGN